MIQKLEEIVEPEKKKERKDTQANRNGKPKLQAPVEDNA